MANVREHLGDVFCGGEFFECFDAFKFGFVEIAYEDVSGRRWIIVIRYHFPGFDEAFAVHITLR